MPKNVTRFLTLLAAACFLSNCATIIHGSRQNIIILSVPKKADLEIDGINFGSTPYVARLTRRDKHQVKVFLEGYVPYEITLTRKLDGWLFGNIAFGGIIGLGVDAATGAMFHLTPKDIYAELAATSTTATKTTKGIYLAVVLKPNAAWEKIGQLEKSPSVEGITDGHQKAKE